MSAATTIPTGSQISPVDERIYQQTNLLGDWKGSWTKNHQPIEIKVDSINGSTAQVEYTHNGHTEKGTGTVDGRTITYGNVTIATRNGTQAAVEFAFGTATQSAILAKSAAPADQNKLVGNWIGSTATQTAAFQVISISGRDAQVRYSIDGQTAQGVGDASKNAVNLGKVAFSTADGLNGTVTFPVGHNTYTLAVKKFSPKTA
ncbi:hypothetical protein [Bradyrhizobium sp.]|uniref:hypothetical protein n=1 Tax=Bradyrhizobium sp. TaxID=376 RepID=UPI003C24DF2F